MTTRIIIVTYIVCSILTSCSNYESGNTLSSGHSSNEHGNSENQHQAGVITAAEWNDLDNWSFWEALISSEEFKAMPQYWAIYNNNRIVVRAVDSAERPVIDVLVKLKRDGNTIFTSRTDNKGQAELWVDIFQSNKPADFSKLSIDINDGENMLLHVKPYVEGTNDIVIQAAANSNKIEISFVVDATGSMGDELEFLKSELLDVISRIQIANPNILILTSSVFYRDEDDDYITRVSDFTSDINETNDFIENQNADGGADFPEAVHSALDQAINELQWSTKAITRILFLVLDAPPHHENTVISKMQSLLLKASEKGIRIIPITASGIDKETESLMRFMAITTNGTYVFITDDSGIGNSHLQASVGDYQVELLNNLMVRLINQYAELTD